MTSIKIFELYCIGQALLVQGATVDLARNPRAYKKGRYLFVVYLVAVAVSLAVAVAVGVVVVVVVVVVAVAVVVVVAVGES